MERFRFNSILALHTRIHTGAYPLTCPYCGHRAGQRASLRLHLRSHCPEARARLGHQSRLLLELEERALLRGQEEEEKNERGAAAPAPRPPLPTFRCPFCKGKFRTAGERERHLRILHQPYKCGQCSFAATQEADLQWHNQQAHKPPTPPAPVPAASVPPTPPASTPSAPPASAPNEFRCQVCGQAFTQSWFLKGHMRKHKDSFDHKCQPTDKAGTGNFLGYGDASCAERLQATARAVESGQQWRERHYAGEPKRENPGGAHRCPDCARSFSTFQQMALHRQSHLSRDREWGKGQTLGSHLLTGHWLPANVRASAASNTSPSLLTQEEKGKYELNSQLVPVLCHHA
uniref:Uncharacterized protein n=1 Tax=Sphaerodactylus townsendi TaxID=933632 RepID=A0ACB8EVB9_9SAUR